MLTCVVVVAVVAEHLSDEVRRLIQRCGNSGFDGMSRKRQRRFMRFEREALKCGDDVQDLQRFVNAQVMAFRKILKKYRVCGPEPPGQLSKAMADVTNRNGPDLAP